MTAKMRKPYLSVAIVATILSLPTTLAFGVLPPVTTFRQQQTLFLPPLFAADAYTLEPVPDDLTGIPIPFVEKDSFIECYADSVAVLDNIKYTIGVPCDYAVAICSYSNSNNDDEEQQLVPIELDDPLMDALFSLAEQIITDEFGEEVVLQRTPQTLTLVGDLDLDDQDDDDLDHASDDDDDDDEQVEVLLSFEYENNGESQEYSLVRLLDPILLVGKEDPSNPQNRILLDPDESESIMPILEDLFLQYNDDDDEDYDDEDQ